MKIYSKYIEEAVEQLSSLPGIGKKTALRLVLNILRRDSESIELFSSAFTDMKKHVQECEVCGNISDQPMCEICADERRNHAQICVVEDIRDVMAIESTGTYKGVYHVLGGIISPMDGIGPADLNIPSLINRASSDSISEIIFALSPTMEGDTTNFYLYKKLGSTGIFISALSRGVAVGTELQYADELTLGRSLTQRQEFKG